MALGQGRRAMAFVDPGRFGLKEGLKKGLKKGLGMRDTTIDEAFQRFHAENPWILDRLISMTQKLHGKNRKRYGIKMLWEVLRWHVATGEIKTDEDFKLNNNFTSRYARLIVKLHPEYESMFETRVLRSD